MPPKSPRWPEALPFYDLRLKYECCWDAYISAMCKKLDEENLGYDDLTCQEMASCAEYWERCMKFGTR